MALFTMGDLHLSFAVNKPMDKFGGWENYVERISENWENTVSPEDTVVIPGDISWAMNFREALPDFDFIHKLKGTKIISKGNHDYWWNTYAKMNRFLEENGFDSIKILHNNHFAYDKYGICGTRGWINDNSEPADAKVLAREAGRLETSLCSAEAAGPQLPPPPAQPIHALVLSASPLQTEILCRHFSALGIDALTATNTEEAVRKAQELPKKQPDLLFLDRKLSEPNTLYALRALRTAFGRTIPAILMDEHAGEQILSVSNRDAAQHDGQVAILSLVTLRGLHESIVSLNEPCLVAYSGRLHPQPSPMETPLFHDVRILVAEDNPTNQEIMEALFEDTGVQLTIVSNGKQALDALRVGAQRGERFDLVLMDVQMPVMDGYEATRIIRTMPELEGLPIVAITAHAMHEDKMRALSAGIARYLSKPLSRAALFGTLRALLPNKILPRKPEQATHRSESAALSAPIVLNNTALPPCLDAGAIERLNVSPETYQKILRGYVRNTSEALPALRKGLYLDPAMPEQALCRPAWEWLIREAHNLKGASANVGAIAVQQDAHALELALKQFVRQSGNAAVETAALAQTFSPLLGALEEAFATVQTSVLEALPETPQPQEAPPQPVQAGTLDEDQKAQLQHFKEMLALADPERIAEALMPLTAFLPSALMEKLQQAIDFYDYDEALALLPPDTL